MHLGLELLGVFDVGRGDIGEVLRAQRVIVGAGHAVDHRLGGASETRGALRDSVFGAGDVGLADSVWSETPDALNADILQTLTQRIPQ